MMTKTKFTTAIFLLLFAITTSTNAQEFTQTIRGTVIDNDSKTSLPGANVLILGL